MDAAVVEVHAAFMRMPRALCYPPVEQTVTFTNGTYMHPMTHVPSPPRRAGARAAPGASPCPRPRLHGPAHRDAVLGAPHHGHAQGVVGVRRPTPAVPEGLPAAGVEPHAAAGGELGAGHGGAVGAHACGRLPPHPAGESGGGGCCSSVVTRAVLVCKPPSLPLPPHPSRSPPPPQCLVLSGLSPSLPTVSGMRTLRAPATAEAGAGGVAPDLFATLRHRSPSPDGSLRLGRHTAASNRPGSATAVRGKRCPC